MKKKDIGKQELYPWSCIYKGRRRILIWSTENEMGDAFLIDADGRLICASTKNGLRKFLGKNYSIVRWADNYTMNFDRFWRVLRNMRAGKGCSVSECNVINNGWNFIEDLLRTLNMDKLQRRLKAHKLNFMYKKFFHGQNLPAITPTGKHYTPYFTYSEICILRRNFTVVWDALIKDGRFVAVL